MRLEDLPPAMQKQALAALGEDAPKAKKSRKGDTSVHVNGWCATCLVHFTHAPTWEKHCKENAGHRRFELIRSALPIEGES